MAPVERSVWWTSDH